MASQADRRRELAELQPAQMPHVDNHHPGFTDRDADAAQIEAVVEAAQAAVGAIVRAVDLEASANRYAQPRFAEVQQWNLARRALQPGLAQCIEVPALPVLPSDVRWRTRAPSVPSTASPPRVR
jgi:hypothetical protein